MLSLPVEAPILTHVLMVSFELVLGSSSKFVEIPLAPSSCNDWPPALASVTLPSVLVLLPHVSVKVIAPDGLPGIVAVKVAGWPTRSRIGRHVERNRRRGEQCALLEALDA